MGDTALIALSTFFFFFQAKGAMPALSLVVGLFDFAFFFSFFSLSLVIFLPPLLRWWMY